MTQNSARNAKPQRFDPAGAPGARTDAKSGAITVKLGPERAYVYDRAIVLAVNAALATNRPLLVAGSPGTAIKEITLPTRWDELMEKAGYRPLREFYLK